MAVVNAEGAREVFGIPEGVRPSAVNLMTNPNRFQLLRLVYCDETSPASTDSELRLLTVSG
jgi:hypothetical protein